MSTCNSATFRACPIPEDTSLSGKIVGLNSVSRHGFVEVTYKGKTERLIFAANAVEGWKKKIASNNIPGFEGGLHEGSEVKVVVGRSFIAKSILPASPA